MNLQTSLMILSPHGIKLKNFLGKDFNYKENEKIVNKLIKHDKGAKLDVGTKVLCKEFSKNGRNYLRIGYIAKVLTQNNVKNPEIYGELPLYKVNFDQEGAFWRLYEDGIDEETKELTGHGFNLKTNSPDYGILLDAQRLYSVPDGFDKNSKYFVWDHVSGQALQAHMAENPNFLNWFRWIYLDGKIKWEEIGPNGQGYPTFKDEDGNETPAPVVSISLPWSGIIHKRGGNI